MSVLLYVCVHLIVYFESREREHGKKWLLRRNPSSFQVPCRYTTQGIASLEKWNFWL